MNPLLNNIKHQIKGDKVIWVFVALLGLYSFLPIYSSSTNLVYVIGKGTTMGILIKHALLLMTGFIIMFFSHKIPYKFWGGISIIVFPIMILLLFITLMQGSTISGANASRWITIPIIGISFQTSALGSLILIVYTCRYLSKNKDSEIDLKKSLLHLWLPLGFSLLLILPANFSTTAIIFLIVLILCFIGGYPLKYLASIITAGIVFLFLFMLIAKSFPILIPNRVDTWISRIKSISESEKESYQVENAKIAIATGGISGKGPGKSIQKNFLPQSSSDFIFAIIVEELGLIGAFALIIIYFVLMFRFYVAVKNSNTVFGKLLIVGLGFSIIIQAIINMMVASKFLLPVTGQTLPLISSGGSSIWITCLKIGIVLNISSHKDNPIEMKDEAISTAVNQQSEFERNLMKN